MITDRKIRSAATRYPFRGAPKPDRGALSGDRQTGHFGVPSAHAWLRRLSTIWKMVKQRMIAARISDSAAP